MAAPDSVTDWLTRLKAGDAVAAQLLWERYFARLVALARSRLATARKGVSDEEDAALSAFDSFCRGAVDGRFPRLDDRDDLWRVLVVIVHRKAADHAKRERRLKRGGPDLSTVEIDWEVVLSSEPGPDVAAEVAEECERLLALLGDETLRAIAVGKMEGYTVEELAEKLGCAPRTVERKLRLIRELWGGEERKS